MADGYCYYLLLAGCSSACCELRGACRWLLAAAGLLLLHLAPPAASSLVGMFGFGLGQGSLARTTQAGRLAGLLTPAQQSGGWGFR